MSKDNETHIDMVNFPKLQRFKYDVSDDIMLLGSKLSHMLDSKLVAPKDIMKWPNGIQDTKRKL